jgi:hypothetical protein
VKTGITGNRHDIARFQVLTVASIIIMSVFRDVVPCRLIETDHEGLIMGSSKHV